MPTAIDQRRLRDGARALETTVMRPQTLTEALVQLAVVDDGIAALWALNDLGAEANAQVLRDVRELRKRREALVQRLVQLEGKKVTP